MSNAIRLTVMLIIVVLIGVAFLGISRGVTGQEADKMPLIIAHRGASMDAPENTVASYKLAWERDADGAETDVHVTKDGKLVCIHDDTLERTGGDGGAVSDMNFDEVRKAEVGSFKDEKYRGEKVPTLTEVLQTVPQGKLFFVEIKKGKDAEKAVTLVKQDIAASGINPNQIVVISFDPAAVKFSKQQMPDIPAYLLLEFKQNDSTGQWSPTADEIISQLKAVNANGVDINTKYKVDKAFIDKIKSAGYSYNIWTINSPHIAKYYAEIGVDSITTDRPAFIRRALEGEPKQKPTTMDAIPLEPAR
ncbi:glycerophosphodiester phosphodiesterase [Planctomycetota bacterium]|nr:glycerophosphodiester phosphodiesterase [Planctomycetota bacterium]